MRYSVNVILRDERPNKSGSYPVNIRLFIQKRMVVVPVGISVGRQYFDKKRQRVKNKHPHAEDFNALIDDALARAHRIMTDYRLKDQLLTKDIFIQEYHNPEIRRDFIEFFEKEVEHRNVHKNTRAANRKTLNKLRRWKASIPFNDITPGLIEEFEEHLAHNLGNHQNTIATDMKHIKIYVRLALKKGIQFNDPFKTYQISKSPTYPTYLTEQEVQRLVRYYHDDESPRTHRKVLQYFLFACFTSLRISDLKVVEREDIKDGELVITPEKTKNYAKKVRIPMSKAAWDYVTVETGKLFNCYKDQVSNRLLKEVAMATGIDKNITTHVGRHTFATLALQKGMRLEYLQEIMGHGSIRTTEIYKHVLGEEVKKAMQPFNEMAWHNQLKVVKRKNS